MQLVWAAIGSVITEDSLITTFLFGADRHSSSIKHCYTMHIFNSFLVILYQQEVSTIQQYQPSLYLIIYISLHLEYANPYHPREVTVCQNKTVPLSLTLSPLQDCFDKKKWSVRSSVVFFPSRSALTMSKHILRGRRTEVNAKGTQRKPEEACTV